MKLTFKKYFSFFYHVVPDFETLFLGTTLSLKSIKTKEEKSPNSKMPQFKGTSLTPFKFSMFKIFVMVFGFSDKLSQKCTRY